MRTVEHDGDRYLLLKRSEDSSLVRDPETGEERYLPNVELTATGDAPLAVAAQRVPAPTRRVLTAVHSEQALGLLVELQTRGALSVRALLGDTDLCESNLHGLVGELRAADIIAETEVDGERGYRLTDSGRDALAGLTEPD